MKKSYGLTSIEISDSTYFYIYVLPFLMHIIRWMLIYADAGSMHSFMMFYICSVHKVLTYSRVSIMSGHR